MRLIGQILGTVQRVMDQVGDRRGTAAFVGNGEIEVECLEPAQCSGLEALLMLGGRNIAIGQENGV